MCRAGWRGTPRWLEEALAQEQEILLLLSGGHPRLLSSPLEEMLMVDAGAGETACSNPKEWQGISLLADELRGSWEFHPVAVDVVTDESAACSNRLVWISG